MRCLVLALVLFACVPPLLTGSVLGRGALRWACRAGLWQCACVACDALTDLLGYGGRWEGEER